MPSSVTNGNPPVLVTQTIGVPGVGTSTVVVAPPSTSESVPVESTNDASGRSLLLGLDFAVALPAVMTVLMLYL
jgi:hypothetical protein